MELTVNRIDSYAYSVVGDGINVKAVSYESFGKKADISKATGTGSRKIKEQLPELIYEFIISERESKRQVLQEQAQIFCENFIKSAKADIAVWRSIDNRKLYDVTVSYGYTDNGYGGYTDDTKTSETIFNGRQLKQEINRRQVLAFTEHYIGNDDLYVIGNGRDYERHAQEDERIIIVMNTAYITGLSVKEKLSENESFYNIYKNRTANEVVMDNARKYAEGNIVSVFAMATNKVKEDQRAVDNMYYRLLKELERVLVTTSFTMKPEEIFIEVSGKHDTFYFGETYGCVGDAALDKTADIQIEYGDHVKGTQTGLFVEYRERLYDLYHPIENIGNPREQV